MSCKEDNKLFNKPEDQEAFTNEAFHLLVKFTGQCNNLPADLSFYETTSPEIHSSLESLRQKVLTQCNDLLDFMNPLKNNEKSLQIIPFFDKEDVVDRFDTTTGDLLDLVYEKIDTILDKIKRENLKSKNKSKKEAKNIASPSSDQAQINSVKFSETGASIALAAHLKHSEFIAKPQLNFTDIDNYAEIFVPKLKEKPNAIVPLKESLKIQEVSKAEIHLQSITMGENRPKYINPYEHEIKNHQYPSHLIQKKTELLPKPIGSKDYVWVDSVDGLNEMASDLEVQQEIAIDLEAFDYRSYQGMVCLMQISTRDTDYLVDTLKLRNHMGVLLDCFTDPNIVKVMHGADRDIIWLQRDLGLYIVNLFDTYRAAKQLGTSKFSLAYLLDFYVGVQANKEYQLADWRIRPLPGDFAKYAREDTHYLLYIYDRMRNALLSLPENAPNHEALFAVLEKSKETTLQSYEAPVYEEESFRDIMRRYSDHSYSWLEVQLCKALHKWRDDKARLYDESVHYVMSDYFIFKLVTGKPVDLNSMVRMFEKLPTLVTKNAKELITLIENVSRSVSKQQGPINVETVVPPKVYKAKHVRFPIDEDTEMADIPTNVVAVGEPETSQVNDYSSQEGYFDNNCTSTNNDDLKIPSVKDIRITLTNNDDLRIPSVKEIRNIKPVAYENQTSSFIYSSTSSINNPNRDLKDDSLPFIKSMSVWLVKAECENNQDPVFEIQNEVYTGEQMAEAQQQTPEEQTTEQKEEQVNDEVIKINSDAEVKEDEVFILSEKNNSKDKKKRKRKSKDNKSEKKQIVSDDSTIRKIVSVADMAAMAKERMNQVQNEVKKESQSPKHGNPYTEIVLDPKLAKKDPRQKLYMKSGSRQVTFSKK